MTWHVEQSDSEIGNAEASWTQHFETEAEARAYAKDQDDWDNAHGWVYHYAVWETR